MTLEEFEKTSFGAKMIVIFNDEKRNIVSVDFDQSLIGLETDDEGEVKWVRCENAIIVK